MNPNNQNPSPNNQPTPQAPAPGPQPTAQPIAQPMQPAQPVAQPQAQPTQPQIQPTQPAQPIIQTQPTRPVQPTAQPQTQPEQPTAQPMAQPQAQPAPQATAQAMPNQTITSNQSQSLPTQSLQPQPAKASALDKFKNKKTIAIIAGVIIAVVVLVVAGFLLLQPNKQDYKDALNKADKITDSLREFSNANSEISFKSLKTISEKKMDKGLYKKFEKKINKTMDMSIVLLSSTKIAYFEMRDCHNSFSGLNLDKSSFVDKIDKCIDNLKKVEKTNFKPTDIYVASSKKLFIKLRGVGKNILKEENLSSKNRDKLSQIESDLDKAPEKHLNSINKISKGLDFSKEWKKLYEFLEEESK